MLLHSRAARFATLVAVLVSTLAACTSTSAGTTGADGACTPSDSPVDQLRRV